MAELLLGLSLLKCFVFVYFYKDYMIWQTLYCLIE